jgi:Rha family phage regulatory protein
MNEPISDLTLFISKQDNELTTDSRAVAIAFNRRHKDVLRSINSMVNNKQPEIAEHCRRNFAPADFVDAQGKSRPMYRITEKGFAELAMGFTGDLSRLMRVRFLNAFGVMASRLVEADRSITKMLLDHDRRAAASEARGRVGSQLMHRRRQEKPELEDEERRLRDAAQPVLLQ